MFAAKSLKLWGNIMIELNWTNLLLLSGKMNIAIHKISGKIVIFICE